MSPSGQIRLVFSDGETLHFSPIGGETILASAEKAGHALASNCRAGTCRTCMARDDNEEEVLLCITPAVADVSLNLPYRRTDLISPSLRRAKINSFSRVSRSAWEVRYRLQFPLPFLPGQYVEATFPGIDGSRRFSMANAPSQTEQVLHVRDLPGGAMSDYLRTRATPGDPFTVRGPYGVFYLRSTAKPKLFVSGGTGLAPIVSMLSSMDPASAPPLSAVVGFAYADDSYCLDQLRALSKKLPLEVILTADSVGDNGWPGVVANPVVALREVTRVPLGCGTEAYLCGPPGMVAAVRKELLARGFDAADVLNEEFVHSA